MWTEKEVSISEVKNLLDNGFEVEVESPDGWVGVNFFIEKGMFREHLLLDEDRKVVVQCNEGHLFETALGWRSAQELCDRGPINILTKKGYKKFEVVSTEEMIPIVDINVNHPNHRYFTNGVSSHNTGVGKSLAMCHMAAANMMMGKNVLYITLEMSETRIAERIDANLMGVSIQDLAIMPKDVFDKKIDRIKRSTQGKLVVKEYPTATGSASHFRHLINELKIKKNFSPDIIYIDYINICASSRIKMGNAVNTYMIVKAIAEEVRGLAIEFDVPIVTATQVNRGGMNSTDIDLTDTSESIGLPQTADLMIALISSEELEERNQILVKQLKNRYNDPASNRKFIIGIDRAKMKLYNVEESAQDFTAKTKQQDKPVFDNSDFGQEEFERRPTKKGGKKPLDKSNWKF